MPYDEVPTMPAHLSSHTKARNIAEDFSSLELVASSEVTACGSRWRSLCAGHERIIIVIWPLFREARAQRRVLPYRFPCDGSRNLVLHQCETALLSLHLSIFLPDRQRHYYTTLLMVPLYPTCS